MRKLTLLLLAATFVLIAVSSAATLISAAGKKGKKDDNSGGDDGFSVVGARVITCAGCKLNTLPRVRSFLENEARSYPALYIEYHNGKDPELQFLEKHRRVVSTHDLSPLSPLQIAQLLNSNNIHTWTPAPNYEPPEFDHTESCVAFRQTAECSPTGPREPAFDQPCLAIIDEGTSGYCECKGEGKKNVDLPCGHEADTCDHFCDPEGEKIPAELEVPQPPNDDL